MTRVGILAAVIIIIVAAVFFGFRKAAREHAQATGSAKLQPTPKGTPGEHPRSVRKIDPESRKLLLAHIEEARTKRAASGGVTTAVAPSLPPAELSKEYIRKQVKAIVPLVIECYETALAEDPKLAGTVVMKFAIGGEPDVGGLVENSEVDAKASTIAHAGMIECMRETMYALELVAPAEGGRVDIVYPFTFRPASD